MMGLDDLVPPTRTLSVGGREVVVSPLRMRQVPGFGKAIHKPWAAIISGDYLVAVMEWPAEINAAMSEATGLDRSFLDNLLPNEFLQLATAVFEVNLDFFGREVLPQAKALGQAMAAAAMRSPLQPDSSGSDTATATSSTTPLPN